VGSITAFTCDVCQEVNCQRFEGNGHNRRHRHPHRRVSPNFLLEVEVLTSAGIDVIAEVATSANRSW
jgi:hypothetical protein